VFEVEPRQCPGFKFRKSIFIGTTCLDPIQVREFMERESASYNGDTYHLIAKNCNHFCKDICYMLTGKQIPKWVNRLAKIGNSFLISLLDTLVLFAQNFVQNFINKHFEFKNLLVSTKIGPLLNSCPIMAMPPIQSRGDRFCHKRPSIFLFLFFYNASLNERFTGYHSLPRLCYFSLGNRRRLHNQCDLNYC
jgi:hypothetical protein